MDTIGTKIKYIRQERRLTQDKLGKELGFSKQIVSNYENDLSKPSYDFLSKLNQIYNVNLNWLIADVGEPFNIPPFEEVEDEFTARVRKIIQEELAKKRND